MGAEWYGDTDGAFFKFDDISPRRKIRNSFYPLEIYKNHQIKIPELVPNEKRILSVDVALLASKKHNNDAAALIINSAIPTEKNDYISNIVYIETHEGMTTDELGILVMRLFYQFNCTDLVLDTNGQGIGVYDFIIKPQYDAEYGVTYEAMTCMKKPDDNSESNLLPIISALTNHPGFKYKLEELKQVKIYQFYDAVQRLQIYEQTHALMGGSYSGFCDTSKIDKEQFNFMREI